MLPDSVRTVGKSAFYKCVSLATLTLGNSLERIGDFAFYNDSGIGSLILPGTLKQVGKYAFKGLNSLTALIIPKEVATVAGNAFYGCSNATFYIEEGADTSEWNRRWNSSNRPVVSGVRLADEGGYAASLTTGEGTVKNGTYLSDRSRRLRIPRARAIPLRAGAARTERRSQPGRFPECRRERFDCGADPGGMTNDPGGAVWHRIRIYVRKHMTNQMCKQRLFVKSKEECHEKFRIFFCCCACWLLPLERWRWRAGKTRQSDAGGAGQS